MNEDLANLQFIPIRDYKYARFFDEVQYKDKTLSDSERKDFISIIDETVEQFSEGFPLITNVLDSIKDQNDEFHEIMRTLYSIFLFVLITMIDSMVASKFFLRADKDYDKRFMRGKMFVILNEGFKKLYGFDDKTYKKSEWDRLLSLMKYFPEIINRQYQDLTFYLEKLAKLSTWWRPERNHETHLEAEQLYLSRQEDIVESKVIMDSMKLFNALLGVNHFLSNVHACLTNDLITKFQNGVLK